MNLFNTKSVFILVLGILLNTFCNGQSTKKTLIITKDSLDLGIGKNIFLGSGVIPKEFNGRDKFNYLHWDICYKGEYENAIITFFPRSRYIFEIYIHKDQSTKCNPIPIKYQGKMRTDYFDIGLGDNFVDVLDKLKGNNYQIDSAKANIKKITLTGTVKFEANNFESDSTQYHGDYIFLNEKLISIFLHLDP